ncbi:hypothetical protein I551_0994 [Mycobacterium ulcerans str. Harvey]|uniref:Uncharacterized protein n=1 Tax=Mycobacterium ulcerans str. Harvey TaxID=1299332 RepID=A0ABP3AN16_MYCUL|nr:hypothetical protein I551_0994 [Mycobacterium ulcerans str. Harvey]
MKFLRTCPSRLPDNLRWLSPWMRCIPSLTAKLICATLKSTT